MISIIIGFILGYIVSGIHIRKNLNYHGPDSNIIRIYIYQFGNKYYKFTPEVCICPLGC